DRVVLGAGPTPSDDQLAALAFAVGRKQLAANDAGGRRTVCLLLHRSGRDGLLRAEVTTACWTRGGAGCSAEVAAVSRLLLRCGCRTPLEGVERMVVAVDADHLVPPDPRGCELLVEHADLAVPIVCAWLE
ncbi:unnamed protein product, partial [Prorocentrum cordatum]